MRIKKFFEFSNSHPPGLPIFTYTGVNYGNAGSGVAGTFGNKGGSERTDSGLKGNSSSGAGFAGLSCSEESGKDFSEDELKNLVIKYNTWCMSNGKSPIQITNLDPKTVDYILKEMGEDAPE